MSTKRTEWLENAAKILSGVMAERTGLTAVSRKGTDDPKGSTST